MLKKIIFIFILCFPFLVHAELSVDISTGKSKVQVGESFDLNIQLHTDNQGTVEIKNIEGVDAFQIFGQNSSDSIQIINGVSSINKNINLSLGTEKPGIYVLGPVTILSDEGEVISQSIQIEVKDNKEITSQQNISKSGNDDISKSDKNNENKNIKKELSDIHGVKYLKMIWDDFLYIPVFIFIFSFLVYFILNKYFGKYLHKLNQYGEPKEIVKIVKTDLDILISHLQKLSKKTEELNKGDFYKELNFLFRNFFEIQGLKGAQNLTFNEIKQLSIGKNIEILTLFEESYLTEFSNKNPRTDTKKNIIKSFINLIKKEK